MIAVHILSKIYISKAMFGSYYTGQFFVPTRKSVRKRNLFLSGIHSICNSPLYGSAWHSFSPLQKLHRNHRSYVWTETLSGGFHTGAKATR